MEYELDYSHILNTMRKHIINPRNVGNYLYFDENSYYSRSGSTHFMNLEFDKGVSYYIVFWDGQVQRASITKTYDSDTFDDDTREIFKLFDMYSDEEQHFMDSTVKNIVVPFEVMEELRKFSANLQELYNVHIPE